MKVTVLYIDPVSKVIAMSELKHLAKPEVTSADKLTVVSVGSVVTDAVIVHVDAKRGVRLRLPEKQKAHANVCIYIMCKAFLHLNLTAIIMNTCSLQNILKGCVAQCAFG